MRVNAPQTAKSFLRHARATKIRHLDCFGIADHHIFDLTFAIKKHADLSAGFKRNFRQLPRKFRRNDLFGRNAARRQTFDTAKLIMF